MMATMEGQQDVPVVTSVDEPTYGVYARVAAALCASTPALMRHVLSGVAPALAEAAALAESAGDDGSPAAAASLERMHVSTTLLCGDIIVGDGGRYALNSRAVQAHERAVATITQTTNLLEQARQTCTAAQAAIAEAYSGA